MKSANLKIGHPSLTLGNESAFMFISGEEPCDTKTNITKILAFEPMSKRRRGFPSETNVKRGVRIVHGNKQLEEKLGRNDPCPCGSGKRFKRCCLQSGHF